MNWWETLGNLRASSHGQYFQAVFTAESGDLTLSVSLGRMVGGKYKAMSDTASVMFEAPDDLRALDQTYAEYAREVSDIVGDYNNNEDAERWLGEDGSGSGRSLWNSDPGQSFKAAFYGADALVGGAFLDSGNNTDNNQGIIIAHLNNQLK